MILVLRIVKHHHESSVHVILLVTVQEGFSRIIGYELYLNGPTSMDQHHIFPHNRLSQRCPSIRRTSNVCRWRCMGWSSMLLFFMIRRYRCPACSDGEFPGFEF